ncbi:MAG: phage holin family protein [Conexibacteraceae bacterium]|nr:phage holin family protein [Conexibacteraceae bacterium]
MPADDGQSDSIATAITEVSESLTKLVHEEIELAKAEVAQKTTSLARGAAAVAAGAVFGIFAVVFILFTIAWALSTILVSGVPDIWIGFVIVAGTLVLLAVFAFLFAWRKLRVGAPTPDMAIDEAKKIRETVTTSAGN